MSQLSYSRNTEKYSFIYDTIGSRMRHWAQTQPNKAAIVVYMSDVKREVLTFGELYDKAVKLARYYVSVGVKPGDKIAVFVYNSPEWLIASVACSLAGAVAINSFTFAAENDLDIIRTIGCKVLVADGRDAKYKAFMLRNITKVRQKGYAIIIITVQDLNFTPGEDSQEISFQQVLRNEATEGVELPGVQDAEKLVAIFQTAGTTGVPRFVPYNHLTLINSFHLLYTEMGLTNEDVFFSNRPMGFMPGYPMPIVVLGCTFVTRYTQDSADGDFTGKVCKLIQDELVTCGFFPPYLIYGFHNMRLAGFSPEHIPSLQSLIASGQTLPKTELSQFLQYSLTPYVGYGSTEMGWITLCGLDNLPDVDDDVIAALLPATEIKVIDETNHIVPVNTVGEICIRNVSSAGKYLTSDGKYITFIDENGWFHTEDMGYMLNDGKTFCIKGRAAEMIKRPDVKIFPAAIETVLSKHHAIAEVVVVGVPDGHMYQEACACVTIRPGYQLTTSDLEAYAEEKLKLKTSIEEKGLMPRHLIIFDNFPRLLSQKINRQSVAKMAEKLVQAKHI